MDTAAVRVQRHPQGCTVWVEGLVTAALVADLRRLSAEFPATRCDLRRALLSADGSSALRAWHRAAAGTLELLLPDAISPTDPAVPWSPVDLQALLAHEVRGPLSVAHLRLQTQEARLAARGLADEAAACRSAISGLEAVARLLDTYLTASLPWVLRPVDLHVVAAAAAAQAEEQVGRGRTELTCRPAGGPVWVQGDPQALHQLLWNLARNGLEASADGSVRIALAAGGPGHPAIVRITDHGPGFPPEVLEAPFRRRQSTKPGGMGIGLTLCKWIVDRHRGTIALRNRSKGAETRIELPAGPD